MTPNLREECERAAEERFEGQSSVLLRDGFYSGATWMHDRMAEEIAALIKAHNTQCSIAKEFQRLFTQIEPEVSKLNARAERLEKAIRLFWPKSKECEHDMEPNTTMDYFRCDKCGLPSVFETALSGEAE